ncbi:glycosyltransferase [Flavobacterium turcicum]|uniref:Glycosyltransferase n=1 Tax=Flavobacterium turcicum TaxID=2764718 RepID=A0ABR7JJ73_9FLAO|nr:glycosyltransferase [Flavobacterium turcicum]MBC5864219.1 glycosyltransferase [Flavobacterium turcicum]NHL03127.1 glycosyltransferase [Flavobacterium turcicum]
MKLLFVLINMNLGGTEKSFLNLIETLSTDDEVTLLLLENSGELLNEIPDRVKIIYLENSNEINKVINTSFNVLFLQSLKRLKVATAFKSLLYYFISKLDVKNDYYYSFVKNKVPKIDASFDYAIAFAGPHSFISNFVIHKVKAHHKIQWIHFDVSKIYFNKNVMSAIYQKFDKIVCVSADVMTHFLNVLPKLVTKTKVKHNLLLFDKILDLSTEPIKAFNTDVVNIVTVGRLSKEKGHEQFLPTMKRLQDNGYNFCWYIIGDGNQKQHLESVVDNFGMNKSVVFLGKKGNPYPYYKSCDLYLQPSFYEGHCVSILEAKFFKKPIVCTNFSGASEEIINNVNGIIVDFNEDSFYNALEKLIQDKQLRDKMGEYNSKFEFSNPLQSFDFYINS